MKPKENKVDIQKSLRRLTGIMVFILMLLPWVTCRADISPTAPLPDDITTLSLEELMSVDVVVTTITRREKSIQDTPSAVFVITQDDIRRSGATNIPDLLRMVPGFHVSKINSQIHQYSAQNWAISSRGFHGPVSAKLLILIDGRSIFSQITTVNWGQVDVVLEDIDRIEIIRGSAAALWGPNAVNGVVNIITKKAKETTGMLVSSGIETDMGGFALARYGGKVSDSFHYRIYTKYLDNENKQDVSDFDSNIDGGIARSGFRIDKAVGKMDSITCQGDIFSGTTDFSSARSSLTQLLKRYDLETDLLGGNILCNWHHTISNTSEMKLKLYYDKTRNDFSQKNGIEDPNFSSDKSYGFVEETIDVDFQYEFDLNSRNSIIWGTGARLLFDDIWGTSYMRADPQKRRTHLLSAFLQDDITLVKSYLNLSLGIKFEHNDYTGHEMQPGIQLLFTPTPDHTLWASVARSVRTPLRLESDAYYVSEAPDIPIGLFTSSILFEVDGNPDLESEKIHTYEAGYRMRPKKDFYMDIALYYTKYLDLIVAEQGVPIPSRSPVPHLEVPFNLENGRDARAWGGEWCVDWQVKKWLQIQASYTYINLKMDDLPINPDTLMTVDLFKKNSPKHQASIRPSLNITENLEFNTWLRYVDDLPNIKYYYTTDAQIRWKISDNLDLYLIGRNLNGIHTEFITVDFIGSPTKVDRSFFGKLEWRY